MVIKIDRKKLRVKKGRAGLFGSPKLKGRKRSSKNCLFVRKALGDGWMMPRKAAWRHCRRGWRRPRNRNKFKILDEITEMAAAAQCKESPRFDARRGAVSSGKNVQRPVAKKLCVNGGPARIQPNVRKK